MKLFGNLFGPKSNKVYEAIADGNVDEISNYLKSTKNVDNDFEPESILHYAIDNCKNNYEETISFLIINSDNVNSHQSKYSSTPLHKLCAWAEPHMSLIQLLLKNGADVNAKDISGKTPLFNIIFSFSTELLDLLVKYGANVNMRDKYGNSILHDDYSGRDAQNFEELLIALINLGFDINSRNSAGYTILGFCKNEIFADILKKHHGTE